MNSQIHYPTPAMNQLPSDSDVITETTGHYHPSFPSAHPAYAYSPQGQSSQGFVADRYSHAPVVGVASTWNDIDTSATTLSPLDSQPDIAPTCIDLRLLYNSASTDVPVQDTTHYNYGSGSDAAGVHAGNAPFSDNNRPLIMPTTTGTSSAAAYHQPQALTPYTTRTYTVYANAGILYLSLGPSHSGVRVDVHVPVSDVLAPTFMMMDSATTAATGDGGYPSDDAGVFARHQAPDNIVQGVPQAGSWAQFTNN